MSLIELAPAAPVTDYEPGTYEMELANIEPKVFDQWAGQVSNYGKVDDGKRLIWTWVDPEDDSNYVEALTSLSTGTKSRVYEIACAIVGIEKATTISQSGRLDTSEFIGKRALVTLEITEKGYPKVTKITALPTKRRRPVIEAEAVEEVEDAVTSKMPF